jgi:hypothetical protein
MIVYMMSRHMTPFRKFQYVFSHPVRLGALVAVGLFALYLTTLPVHNVGYADSDLLLTIGKYAGVAHPPGYPLYILLLYLVLALPLNGLTVAAQGHLLSAVLSAITLFLLFQVIYKGILSSSYGKTGKPSSRAALIISTLAILSLGLSHLFWLYSVVAEKYALLGTIAVAAVYMLFSGLLTSSTRKIKLLLLSVFLLGVAISHHQVALVLIIPFGYALFPFIKKANSKIRLKLAGVLIAGVILPLLLLFPLNDRQAPVSWQFEPTLTGWINHVLRSDFYDDSVNQEMIAGLFQSPDLNRGLSAIVQYLRLTMQGFGWWIILPLALVMQRLLFQAKRERLHTVWLLFYLVTGPLVAFLLPWTDDWGSQGIAMRQWYLGSIFLTPILSLGLVDLFARTKKSAQVLRAKAWLYPSLIIVPLLGLGFQLYQQYPLVNFSNFNAISARYRLVLDQVEPESLVTCYSDTACFALLYEQAVNGYRPDVDIIPLQHHLVRDVINKPGMKGFTYPTNPYLMADIVTWNLRSRPVYAVELSSYYYQFFGIDIPFIHYVPLGYLGRLSYSIPQELPKPHSYELSKVWLTTPLSPLDPYRSFIATTPARDHLTNAQSYLKMDRRLLALEELNIATNLFYRFGPKEKVQIEGLRTNMEQMQPSTAFAPGKTVATAETLLGYIPELLENNYRSRALKAAQGAVLIEPTNIKARLTLANFYTEMGDYFFARMEYLHVIRLDPGNQEATDALATLPQ